MQVVLTNGFGAILEHSNVFESTLTSICHDVVDYL